MKTDWISFFSNKRSNRYNIFFGFWISSLFGVISILSIEATRTILAFLAFMMITGYLTLYFCQKIHIYDVWEKFALKENDSEICKKYQENCEKLSYPESRTKKEAFLHFLAPKSSIELVLQYSIWGGFEVLLLLWKNSTIQHFLGGVLEKFPWFWGISDFVQFEFGPRHMLFCLFFSISLLVFGLGLVIEYINKQNLNRTWKFIQRKIKGQKSNNSTLSKQNLETDSK